MKVAKTQFQANFYARGRPNDLLNEDPNGNFLLVLNTHFMDFRLTMINHLPAEFTLLHTQACCQYESTNSRVLEQAIFYKL